jgi:hypothetical protein
MRKLRRLRWLALAYFGLCFAIGGRYLFRGESQHQFLAGPGGSIIHLQTRSRDVFEGVASSQPVGLPCLRFERRVVLSGLRVVMSTGQGKGASLPLQPSHVDGCPFVHDPQNLPSPRLPRLLRGQRRSVSADRDSRRRPSHGRALRQLDSTWEHPFGTLARLGRVVQPHGDLRRGGGCRGEIKISIENARKRRRIPPERGRGALKSCASLAGRGGLEAERAGRQVSPLGSFPEGWVEIVLGVGRIDSLGPAFGKVGALRVARALRF